MKWIQSLLLLLLLTTSCTKYLEVDPPPTQIDGSGAFKTDAAAISAMTGIYARAALPLGGQFSSLSMCAGLSADELTAYGVGPDALNQLYTNSLTTSFSYFWKELYGYIYSANDAVEGITASTTLSAPVKSRLLGEAKFTRAFFYFYLVNLFGDVPLILVTDYRQNMLMARTPAAKVYEQIIQDLKDAKDLMGESYTAADLKTVSTDRVRPNKWAATALLARAYLFTGDWDNAIAASSEVISQTGVYKLETLANAFLKDGKEALWQLQSTQNNLNTYEGNSFILISAPNYAFPVSLSSGLYNTFEPGDDRKTNWTGAYTSTGTGAKTYPYAYKYKVRAISTATIPITENAIMLRLAEQYLIRAEARIHANKIADGIDDLNALRTRARAAATVAVPNPLPALSTTLNMTDALKAAEHERQVEMFAEMGDRWLTLKRTKGFDNPAISRADEIMPAITTAKGGQWNTDWQLYPIPATEIINDVNLSQNHGYK